MDGYLYIASPYTDVVGGTSVAYIYALKTQEAFIKAGIPVFVPIVHSHPYAVLSSCAQIDWLAQDFPLLDAAKALVVIEFPGWEDSKGIKAEVARATERNILVYHLLPSDLNDLVELRKWASFLSCWKDEWANSLGTPTQLRQEGWEAATPMQGCAPRVFDTGASRDSDEGKLDYEGFLSPFVLKRFAEYMHENRRMKDGTMRASDNWQKGIPLDAYMKSAWRHFHDWWGWHRGLTDDGAEDAICGLLFNAMGYLHCLLVEEQQED